MATEEKDEVKTDPHTFEYLPQSNISSTLTIEKMYTTISKAKAHAQKLPNCIGFCVENNKKPIETKEYLCHFKETDRPQIQDGMNKWHTYLCPMESEDEEKEAEPIRILITGAGGKIGYSICPRLASGAALGPNQPIILHLLDIPKPDKINHMKSMAMELEDCAFPTLKDIVISTVDHPEVAFKDIDVALLIGGFSQWKNERIEMMERNVPIFSGQGAALQKYAKETCKIIVIANPANTNTLICALNAPKIPKTNFCAMTRLDMNRAMTQIAKKAKCSTRNIKNVTVWGNHSDTMVPDVSNATIGGKAVKDVLEEKWISEEFSPLVKFRAKAVLDIDGQASVFSAASAAIDCLRDWFLGSNGSAVAMGVWSDGNPFGIEKGLFFGMPCVCKNGRYQIKSDWKLDDETRKKLKVTEKELLQEKATAMGFLLNK